MRLRGRKTEGVQAWSSKGTLNWTSIMHEHTDLWPWPWVGTGTAVWSGEHDRSFLRQGLSGFTPRPQLVLADERVRPAWQSGSKWDKARALSRALFYGESKPLTDEKDGIMTNNTSTLTTCTGKTFLERKKHVFCFFYSPFWWEKLTKNSGPARGTKLPGMLLPIPCRGPMASSAPTRWRRPKDVHCAHVHCPMLTREDGWINYSRCCRFPRLSLTNGNGESTPALSIIALLVGLSCHESHHDIICCRGCSDFCELGC
jgi:hypothetical protein